MRLLNAKLIAVSLQAFGIAVISTFTILTSGQIVAAQSTKITVGRTTGASGFHIPTYVAMDKGFFDKEGLDAKFVAMTGKALVNAGIARNIDFVPIPGGGSVAALKGAPIRYIVGQSMISQWTITTSKDIQNVKDLKEKTLGLGRPGSADYDEAEIVLSQHFGMKAGEDYKVISFRGEPERIAGLINGDIQGAALSFPHAARAKAKGFKVLIKTGTYLPRLGGAAWTHKDYLKENRDTAKKFIKAIAKAIAYMQNNKEGTVDVIAKYFAMKDRKLAEGVYEEVYDQYSPELSKDLLEKLFQSRVKRLIKRGSWPKDKPLPDLEQFVARDLLNEALEEIGYKFKN